MSHATVLRSMTIADYDAFVAAKSDSSRWELVAGQVVAMTNPSEDHGQIVANLGAPLKSSADAQGCRTNFGGIAVQAAADASGTDKAIPDITVRCGDRVDGNWISDPVIVVEVLSPSTMDYDRGDKLLFYKTLPTLRDIVIIYQDEVRVEHYRRADTVWTVTVSRQPSDTLTFTGITHSATLASIYAGTAPG